MTTLRNNFEGGTNGDGVTAPNSGGLSGDAWTEATGDAAGATFTYSNTGAIHGALCGAFTVAGTSGTARRGWAVNAGATAAPQWIRMYLDPADFTTVVANTPVRGMDSAGTTQRWRIQLQAGVITLRDSANSTIWTSTGLSNGVKYRTEIRIAGSATGSSRIKIFTGENDSPAQDSGEIASSNFGGAIQRIYFGQCAATTNTFGKLDSIAWSDTTWIGPAAATTWQPRINRHVVYLSQKTVGGNANYVKRRPATITGFAADGNPRLRVGRSGEVYGDATTGIVRKFSPTADTVGQYEVN